MDNGLLGRKEEFAYFLSIFHPSITKGMWVIFLITNRTTLTESKQFSHRHCALNRIGIGIIMRCYMKGVKRTSVWTVIVRISLRLPSCINCYPSKYWYLYIRCPRGRPFSTYAKNECFSPFSLRILYRKSDIFNMERKN